MFSSVWMILLKLLYGTNWLKILFQSEEFHLHPVQTKAKPFHLQKCLQSNICIFFLFRCSLGLSWDLSEYLNVAFHNRSLILNFKSIYNINMFIHVQLSMYTSIMPLMTERFIIIMHLKVVSFTHKCHYSRTRCFEMVMT